MKPLLLAIALLLAPVATPRGAPDLSYSPTAGRVLRGAPQGQAHAGYALGFASEPANAEHSSGAPLPLAGALYGPVSWYAYRPGEAAAGPALRAWLGSGWRGTTVRVCTLQRCVVVRLTDTCQCYRGTGHEVLLDLDRAAFSHLAPLSQGIVRALITVELGGPAPEPRPTAPATDTSEDQP